jgi:hypothetical protein
MFSQGFHYAVRANLSIRLRGYPMKKVLLCLFFLIFLFHNLIVAASQKESGCVKCHTDEAALKSLFKPPKISLEEGEG